MVMIQESYPPSRVFEGETKAIHCYDDLGDNIDLNTVRSFGEEWQAFNEFSDQEINKIGDSYFDIVKPEILGKDKKVADFGCGTGRWTKYIHEKVGAIAAIDPSDAIFTASKLLEKAKNVFLYKASIDRLPFPDDHFDFGFSLGVLHHIPDTANAMRSCVKKIKPGGHFLVYLYYSLDNRGPFYKGLFFLSNVIRAMVSKLPPVYKKAVTNFLAMVLYMPFVFLSRLLRYMKVPRKIRAYIPLHIYETASFYIIRNDALDRFGTPLEQRFSKKEIREMMQNAGLINIVFSENAPFWHAIGTKK